MARRHFMSQPTQPLRGRFCQARDEDQLLYERQTSDDVQFLCQRRSSDDVQLLCQRRSSNEVQLLCQRPSDDVQCLSRREPSDIQFLTRTCANLSDHGVETQCQSSMVGYASTLISSESSLRVHADTESSELIGTDTIRHTETEEHQFHQGPHFVDATEVSTDVHLSPRSRPHADVRKEFSDSGPRQTPVPCDDGILNSTAQRPGSRVVADTQIPMRRCGWYYLPGPHFVDTPEVSPDVHLSRRGRSDAEASMVCWIKDYSGLRRAPVTQDKDIHNSTAQRPGSRVVADIQIPNSNAVAQRHPVVAGDQQPVPVASRALSMDGESTAMPRKRSRWDIPPAPPALPGASPPQSGNLNADEPTVVLSTSPLALPRPRGKEDAAAATIAGGLADSGGGSAAYDPFSLSRSPSPESAVGSYVTAEPGVSADVHQGGPGDSDAADSAACDPSPPGPSPAPESAVGAYMTAEPGPSATASACRPLAYALSGAHRRRSNYGDPVIGWCFVPSCTRTPFRCWQSFWVHYTAAHCSRGTRAHVCPLCLTCEVDFPAGHRAKHDAVGAEFACHVDGCDAAFLSRGARLQHVVDFHRAVCG